MIAHPQLSACARDFENGPHQRSQIVTVSYRVFHLASVPLPMSHFELVLAAARGTLTCLVAAAGLVLTQRTQGVSMIFAVSNQSAHASTQLRNVLKRLLKIVSVANEHKRRNCMHPSSDWSIVAFHVWILGQAISSSKVVLVREKPLGRVVGSPLR